MNVEQRALSLIDCRLDNLDDAARSFSGYGNVFDVIDSYNTTFKKGAFEESLDELRSAGREPLMFLNHDYYSLPIGKWTKMEEDDYGLRVEGTLLDTTSGIDTYKALKAGALDGLSIGVIPETWSIREDKSAGPDIEFTKAKIIEVSVVSLPSNAASRIDEVRSLINDGMSIRDLETFLRNHGVSRAAATAVVAQFESKSEIKRLADEQRMIVAMDAFIRSAN